MNCDSLRRSSAVAEAKCPTLTSNTAIRAARPTAFRVAPRNPENELSQDLVMTQQSAPSGNTCYVPVPVPHLNLASSFHQRTSLVFWQHTVVDARIWDEGRCWATALWNGIWHFRTCNESGNNVRVSGARMFASCMLFSWSQHLLHCAHILLLLATVSKLYCFLLSTGPVKTFLCRKSYTYVWVNFLKSTPSKYFVHFLKSTPSKYFVTADLKTILRT